MEIIKKRSRYYVGGRKFTNLVDAESFLALTVKPVEEVQQPEEEEPWEENQV